MNALHTEMNRQHDQARVDAEALRRQALAKMGDGLRQQLAEIGHVTRQGVRRLAARVTQIGHRDTLAQPLSRS